MKQVNGFSTAFEPLDSSAKTLEPLAKAAPGSEPQPAPSSAAAVTKTTPVQMALLVLGVFVFLYFARPVILPVFLACVAGMALKPLIRWLANCQIPPALGAAVVLSVFVAAVGLGFVELGRPAVAWMNDAPEHMAQLRQRVQNVSSHPGLDQSRLRPHSHTVIRQRIAHELSPTTPAWLADCMLNNQQSCKLQ